VHYVAPTVWAYKPSAPNIARSCSIIMLVLLPFEPPYLKSRAAPATWVGHPAVAGTAIGDGEAFRPKYELAPETPLFCLLPGSRKGEVERICPFRQCHHLARAQFPELAMAVAVQERHAVYRALLRRLPVPRHRHLERRG